MADDWGFKISIPNEDVNQALNTLNKKNFVVVSTDSCLRIEEAVWEMLWGMYDIYVVNILTDIDIPISFTFQPDDKDNPTEWSIR